MRRNFLASTALTSTALMAGTAWAADLPVKAVPAPVNARMSWNGCYAGLNAGGAISRLDQNVAVPGVVGFDSSTSKSSFTGGGQIGCNWQPDPSWVLGIEGDFNYLHAKRSQAFGYRFSGEDTVGSQETSLRWLATIRGRLGYTFDRWFLYGTGGLAIGNVKSSVSASDTIPTQYAGSYSSDRTGWAAGLGFEYAFAERLSAKLEWLHYDLGTANYLVGVVSGGPPQQPTPWNGSAKVTGDLIRVGLNYRFTP